MDQKVTGILKSYYDTVETLLEYQCCAESLAIEHAILALLFDFADCSEQFARYRQAVDAAQCIQTCSDEVFLSASTIDYDVLSGIKMQTLAKLNITKLKKFDPFLFADTVRERAGRGRRADCKLLACMNWLGLIVGQNKPIALKIWSLLAVSGDLDAMQMLIRGYAAVHDDAQAEKWRHVHTIVQTEYENFSPVALRTEHPAFSDAELELANLIMCIASRSDAASAQAIDRPMLTYILESGESYASKMCRLHEDTNYCFVLYHEDRYADRHLGFVG